MDVWNGIANYPIGYGRVVASIGNYDGVHRGHRTILDGVVRDAHERGSQAILITFDPHPLEIVAPQRRPRLLQTRRQKLLALEETGIDGVLLITFNAELAALDGEEFFSNVLNDAVSFAAIHVGTNFRFGHNRSGDHALLARIGADRGFSVRGIDPIVFEGEVVSSSATRAAIAAGQVELARKLLGRPFAVEGEVVRGAGRGRDLQFPTANLEVENEMVPLPGVYVTETVVLASRYPSVTNVGVRPTFGGSTLTLETHLIDFEGDLYDRRAEVRFLARIREELHFDSPAALADQIARDRAAAESYFQNLIL